MKERIRSLISVLEHDFNDAEAISGLEELVTGEDAASRADEMIEEFEAGWRRLASAGRFEAAMQVMEMELVITADAARIEILLGEQARLCDEELFDQKTALDKLKQLQATRSDDEALKNRIEAIEAERTNWKQLVETFTKQAEDTTEPALKAHMLYSAAERTYKNHKRGKEIPALLERALGADPTHLGTAKLLERVLKERERFADLAGLYMKLAESRKSKRERAQMLLAAGYTYGRKLEDMDSAALCYSEVLDLSPGEGTALKFLVKYYEEKEDWDHLVAVYEDALHGTLAPDEEMAMLMQVGMIHWRVRGKTDAAEAYFRRLRKIAPAHPGMLGFYRKTLGEAGEKAKLLQILTDAQRATDDKKLADTLTKEIAQLAGAEGGNVEKAIDAWKNVLRQEPANDEARRELKTLYRQTGKWNNLLDALKAEVEALPEADALGRVALLREMADIYKEQLKLEMMVIKTYDQILQLVPDDATALYELMVAYEAAGRWNDLIAILTRRAEIAEEPARKIEILQRIAALWMDRFNNFNRAVEPLEQILAVDPANTGAIEALKGVYQKRRAWRPLIDLMEKEHAALGGDAALRCLKEMAQIAGERLADPALAAELWKRVLDADPRSAEALANLEKLAERNKDWAGLAAVLEKRVSAISDVEEKVQLLTKLGTVWKDRVKDHGKAAEAWMALLGVQPGNAKAMRALKDAYQAAQDWDALEQLFRDAEDYEGLVEVLGIAADRAPDPESKIALSFRCAELYDQPIGQPDRAVRHYERILTVDPKNLRAAEALVPIYKRAEKWNRLVGVLEIALDAAKDREERVLRMDELRELSAAKLNNRALAFQWATRAFEEFPTEPSVREALEVATEGSGAYDVLIELYKKKLDAFPQAERIAVERYIAKVALERLGSVDDAVAGYRAVLAANPADEEALAALDNIFRTTARWDDLSAIIAQRIERAEDADARRGLMIEMAHLYEEGMDEAQRAAAAYKAVLDAYPDSEEALLALERLYQAGEQWNELVDILERHRGLYAGGGDDWRRVGFRMAALFDGEIGDKPRAIAMYRELLDTKPGDPEAIAAAEHLLRDEKHRVEVATMMRPHLQAAGDWRRFAWVLSILIESSDERSARLALNVELADIYADHLDEKRLAFDTLGAALRENAGDVGLWDKMTALAAALAMERDLAERLSEAYGGGAVEGDLAIDLARRLAALYSEALGKPAAAEPYHRRVVAADPAARGSFAALEELYTASERWDDLLQLYRDALAADAVDDKLAFLLKICFIVDEVRRDVPQAIDAYRAVLAIDATNAESIRALTVLYEEAGRYDDLAVLLLDQLGSATGTESVSLLFRLGEISEKHLDAPSDALDYFEKVLAVDPDHLRAQRAIEDLLDSPVLQRSKAVGLRRRAAAILAVNYERQGAAEPLARVLMISLEGEELSRDERIDVLTRVADLRERRLNDIEGAFAALCAAFEMEPGNEIVSCEVARIATACGMELDYCQLLDRVIPKIEDDPALVSRLLVERAKMYDERLGNPEEAERAYRAIIDHDPDNAEAVLPAVEALDKLLTGREAWTDLLAVLRRKVALTIDALARRDVLLRMAEIEESVLERPRQAIALFKEVLEIDDTDATALSGLERLYDRETAWPELVDVLRRRAVLERSADMRREMYLRVARIFEAQIRSADEAIFAYRQVNDEGAPCREALEALSRLFAAAEKWPELLEVYEALGPLAENPAERADLLFKTGELLRAKLVEPERAVSVLGEALAIDAAHAGARKALTSLLESTVKLDAIAILRPLYEIEGNYESLLQCAEIEAAELDDPLEKSRVFRSAAEVAEIGLNDTARAFELMGRAFRCGTASPDLPALLDGLERLAAVTEAHDKLLDLYREVAPDLLDGSLQVRCNLRVAEIAQSAFGDVAVAREHYVKVLDLDGENAAALDALEGIYDTQKQYFELFDIYRRKVQCASDDAGRREILFKQARLCEENLGDISGATQTYEAILESDPEDAQAIAALERLYPKADRYADLMDLLERRVEMTPSGRVDILHRLGELAREKLDDEERALDYFARALDADPSHAPTLASLERKMQDEALRGKVAEILEPVYSRRGDWTKLAEALEARLGACDDPAQRKEFLHRIGTLFEEQLGDLDRAFDTFARLFREDVEDRATWDVLNRLAGVLDCWAKLADVIAKALDDVVGDTPETAKLAFVLGQIYEQRLGKHKEARGAYQRVLAFSPDDSRAFDAVERMLLATEAWPDLLELYRDAADAALDLGQRKGFMFKIAEIRETANNDVDGAIAAYRDIVDIDSSDMRAITALDRLYFGAGKFEELTQHLRMQIDEAPSTGARNDLRRRLAHVFEDNLEDLTSAVDAYEEALSDGDDKALRELERLIMKEEQQQRIAELLEPVYRARDEWKKLVVILNALVGFTEAPGDKVARFREIAQLHEERGRNYNLAFIALAQAFAADPSDRDALGELKRLAEGLGNWEDLTAAIEPHVGDILDEVLKKEVLHLLGHTFDQRLDQPRKAIEAYKAIREIDEVDAEALDALEGLYNLVGEWEGLVGVLAQKAQIASDSARRADLLRTKASIHEDLMGAPRDAIDAYRQSLEADPTSLAALDALERLYESAKEWIDLIDVRRMRLEVVSDPETRLAVMRSVAAVYEEKLDDAAEAIQSWRAVLDESGQDAAALGALDRLYAKEEMFPELLEILGTKRSGTADQMLRVELGMRIGGLDEKELGDLDGAVDAYRDVLGEQPTHAGALEALERLAVDMAVRSKAIAVLEPLHRDAERYDRLAAVLELKIEIADDPAQKLAELLRLAELHEIGRSKPAAAFETYARALAEDPSRADVMDSLERLAGSERMWKELAGVYEGRVEGVYDPAVERALLVRLGDVRDVHLDDPKGAIAAYRRVFEGGDRDARVLSALDRLYGRERQWPALEEVLEAEIEAAPDRGARDSLKLRQGALREREFGDAAGAIAVYSDIVQGSPDNDEALGALEAMLAKDEFVQDVVEILTAAYDVRDERHKTVKLFEARLRVAADASDRVRLLRELAAFQEKVLGDAGSAFDALGQAFKLAPDEAALIEELERLAQELGSWAALVEIAQGAIDAGDLEPADQVELGLRIAEWAASKVGDPRLAEDRYRAVLQVEPDHAGALKALVDLLRELGRFEDLLPVLEKQAAVTYDVGEKKAILFQAARLAESELGDQKRAITAYNEILELDEAETDALDALIGLTEQRGEYAQLVELLLRRARQSLDPAQANEFRHRAATLYVGPLSSDEKAVDVYREILENAPSDEGALGQLERLYEALKRWDDLKDLLLQKLDASASPADRVMVLRGLAHLSEARFDAPDDAIGFLNDLLMSAPRDEAATADLERIYTKTERHSDLVELLEGEADAARESGDTARELTLLVRVGEIFDGALDDKDRATSIYERVLERDPEHTRALAALAKLYEANGDWDRVAEVLRKAAATGRGGPDEAEVHFRLARLAESRLDDEDGALAELRLAVRAHPGHLEANRALARLCRKRGDNAGLCEALAREEANLDDKAKKIALLTEIAQLEGAALGDPAAAVATLERARALDPASVPILLALSDAYVAAGRGDEAIPVVEALIAAETEGGKKRSKQAAAYHQKLAKAYLARGDKAKALANLEGAYKIDVANTEVLISLGKLYYEQGDLDQAVKLFRALLLQKLDASAGATKADIYCYVGEISLKQGDPKKAKGMFQRALDEDKTHEGAKAGLAQC
jgi:golgin subfamily B member 1